MSAHEPLDTSKFTITAEDFKDELDSVLEYVRLASARYDLPTLEDLFVESERNRYWLLCYAIRFAAKCASQRVGDIVTDIADEMMEPEALRNSSCAWSRKVSERLEELDPSEDDTDSDLN